MNLLQKLKEYSIIVVDSSDINCLKSLNSIDATTNPSLIYAAAQNKEYLPLIQKALNYAREKGLKDDNLIDQAYLYLSVLFGKTILEHIPGLVSTEVESIYSFDTNQSVIEAENIIKLYENIGVNKDRILIKLASTWEGLQAARILEKKKIKCNLTLLFDISQAAVAAEIGATLISPFVGRIYDWYKLKHSNEAFAGLSDPGVQSVRNIYSYYKTFHYSTVIMGASFRNIDQILNLAGCPKLTISPKLQNELAGISVDDYHFDFKKNILCPETCSHDPLFTSKIPTDEKHFRWMMNENQMATEKLSEGIRLFHQDTLKLKKFLRNCLE